MRQTVLFGAAVVLLLCQATVHPMRMTSDFSGEWTFVADPNLPAETFTETGHPGVRIRTTQYGSLGASFAATQDAETLTLDVAGLRGRPDHHIVYHLNGSTSRNKEGPFWTATTAKWEGARLVLVTRIDDPNAEPSLPLKRVVWLESSNTLLVETDRPEGTLKSSYVRSE